MKDQEFTQSELITISMLAEKAYSDIKHSQDLQFDPNHKIVLKKLKKLQDKALKLANSKISQNL